VNATVRFVASAATANPSANTAKGAANTNP
jgi:hypothetical protein